MGVLKTTLTRHHPGPEVLKIFEEGRKDDTSVLTVSDGLKDDLSPLSSPKNVRGETPLL